VGKPLGEPFAGLRSARRGSYRVIYAIREPDDRSRKDHGGGGTVEIYRGAHRKDAYRS